MLWYAIDPCTPIARNTIYTQKIKSQINYMLCWKPKIGNFKFLVGGFRLTKECGGFEHISSKVKYQVFYNSRYKSYLPSQLDGTRSRMELGLGANGVTKLVR